MSQIVIPKTMVIEKGGKEFIFTKTGTELCTRCLLLYNCADDVDNFYCNRMVRCGILNYICTEVRNGRY